MPDTGSPWNIPYVEAADLVRDWPADSLLVANAVAAGLSAANNAGIGTNVVTGNSTATFTTTSTSFVDDTSLSVNITPTSATAKVLFIATVECRTSNAAQFILLQPRRADPAAASFGISMSYVPSSVANDPGIATVLGIDSPGTTSTCEYLLSCRLSGAGSVSILRRLITVIEVAA